MADTFKKDLPIGEEAEKMVLKMVQKKYSQAFKKEGNFKPYDIFVPEKNIAIEVKRDIKSNKHENYFIEYKCNGIIQVFLHLGLIIMLYLMRIDLYGLGQINLKVYQKHLAKNGKVFQMEELQK